MTDPQRIRRRDQRILANVASYRRGRLGALALAGLTVAVCVLALLVEPSNQEFLAGSSAQACFCWLALAWVAHARLQHAQSLQLRANACLTCGYDLRGNPAATSCPECGTPVPAAKPDATEGKT
jgi:hypothetical protein